MTTNDNIQDFSLLGGPLHRLGIWFGLVRKETDTFRLGLALGITGWGVLVILALLQGLNSKLFSLEIIGGHVRLLVAIPLFFLCETLVVPRMAQFVSDIVRSHMIPEEELPVLSSDIRRIGVLKDSWLVELIFLVTVYTLPLFASNVLLAGRSGNWDLLLGQTGGKITWVLGWYLGFCLPLYRFLLIRWLWHLVLWFYFLWCIQRRNLRLVPTHPDGVAGLGYIEVVQEHFIPLVLANSAIYSASFAEDIISHRIPFESLYSFIPLVLLQSAILFVGPVLIFSRKLWQCRVTGLSEYMDFASRYVQAFDTKWIRTPEEGCEEPLLGTSDLQSLADLNNSVNIVRGIRWIPVGQKLITELGISALLPLLPLIFLKYHFDELSVRIFKILTGL